MVVVAFDLSRGRVLVFLFVACGMIDCAVLVDVVVVDHAVSADAEVSLFVKLVARRVDCCPCRNNCS